MQSLAESVRMEGGGRTQDEQVIHCAAELFLREGIEGVKMVDIASASGVGVATLYRHFSTKSRIAVAAATLLWRHFNHQLRAIVESDEFAALSGIGRMQVLLEAYCDAYVAHGDFVSFLEEFDHQVVIGQLNRRELVEYGAELDSFYPIFLDAYRRGREDGTIVRELEFRSLYLATAHALIGVAQKLRRGEIIPSDDFSCGRDELDCIVRMALWSLASDSPLPSMPASMHLGGFGPPRKSGSPPKAAGN